MLDTDTKRRIDTCRDILVGKVPDPKSQVEQITIALIYKFMDDMDAEAEERGGKRTFFAGEYDKFGWSKLMAPSMGGFDVLAVGAAGSMPKINQSIVESIPITLPHLAIQQVIVAEIEAEQALVNANRELITRFEKKIQATLARVWGEEEAQG
jgi:hypothetical protein